MQGTSCWSSWNFVVLKSFKNVFCKVRLFFFLILLSCLGWIAYKIYSDFAILTVWLWSGDGIFRYFNQYYVTQINSDGRFRHKRTANDSSEVVTTGLNDGDRWQDEVSMNQTVSG